ncbi:hypothetical protein F5Y04DRAFT_264440 [Hypomontagnella monticulosa]|nr:hypothetical protein F5Y04DRAFT_264440 [Hypomontagnella monticulosa]
MTGVTEGVTNPSKVIIDPDGDLHLTVGESNPVTFLVCSKALARASLVWKKLLYGGFAESVQPDRASGEEWIVKLPEDDPKAIEILLDIIHCRFDRVPTSVALKPAPAVDRALKWSDLYQLTVLTDKYDLTRSLEPWVGRWLKTVPPSGLKADLFAWITWELGDQPLFEVMVMNLILLCPINPGGGLQFGTTKLFSNTLEPPGLSGFVESYRLEAIKKVLQPFVDVVTELLQRKEDEAKRLCNFQGLPFGPGKADCEITMLGVMIQSLSRVDLWPIPKPEEVTMSLNQLISILRRVDMRSRLPGHQCCALPNMGLALNNVPQSIKPQLTGFYQQHLKTQASKSGLDRD